MNPFSNLGERAGNAAPMGGANQPIMPGRILYADGDGLAYYCAGSDETAPERAIANLRDKLAAAQVAARAERVVICTTPSGSNKGDRYAIARVKPYQGQRSNSRRPQNWALLRSLVTESKLYPVELADNAEADDLFAMHGWRDPNNTVILTQDKDMRMVAGWHLDWAMHTMFFLPPGVQAVRHYDKWYGWYWFWLQMLQGDTADNIPGLPKYRNDKGNLALCGEKTAERLLDPVRDSNVNTAFAVLDLYRGFYGADAEVNLLEQACLLWMRPNPTDYLSCLSEVGPLFPLRSLLGPAARVITERVKEAHIVPATEDD